MSAKKPTVAPSAIRSAVLPIDALHAHERNYRGHPQAQLDRLALSLRRFSQFRSVVVQERPDDTYRIVAGHGVIEAMRREGMTEVRADVLPATLDETTIQGILVADNELTRLAEDDTQALAALLQELANAGEHLEAVGSSADELAALMEELAEQSVPDFAPVGEDEQGRLDEKAPVECPNCGHKFVP